MIDDRMSGPGNPGFHGDGPANDTPPQPAAPFVWAREAYGHVLRCEPLGRVTQHLFTSRQLSLPAIDDPDRQARWSRLASASGAVPERLLRVTQVHGRGVLVVRADEPVAAGPDARVEADAIVSNLPGAALLVQVADCVPILLADTASGAVAAVHAGWRGTCAGVASAAVAALVEAFGGRADRIVAAIGPSIGPADYDVGESVFEQFVSAGHGRDAGRWFRRDAGAGALRLDLWTANADQLTAAGVPAAAIHTARLSTLPHRAWFDSYRRDGSTAGRMAALIVVPDRP